jgi:hypothetical protein
MQQECPECARLWDDYVGARTAYAALRREIDSARETGAAAEILVANAKAVFDRKEQSRAALDEHERQSHG